MDYHDLRQIAGSWGLIYLFVLFVVAIAFALRPSAKKYYEDAANIPLKED